ncbi:hypothetical protein ACF0H5_020202 [Mactra antiquata]
MVGQYKRVAVADAKGLPVYQPISNMASYQQAIAAMQLQQPQYIPVSYYVEVNDGRVIVCRDAVRGKCSRPTCKYYHISIPLPPSE